MTRQLTRVTNSAPTASDTACGRPMTTSTAVETRPMMACGVRRCTSVMTETKSSGSDRPTTVTSTSITASDELAAMIPMGTASRTIPRAQVATSPSRRMTRLEARPPTTAPTP